MTRAEATERVFRYICERVGPPKSRGRKKEIEQLLGLYNEGGILPEARKVLGEITVSRFYAWEKRLNERGTLEHGNKHQERGSYALTEEQQRYILALIKDRPHRRPQRICEYLETHFGKEFTASLPTVRRFLRAWKRRERELYTYIANPDKWKSHFKQAQGNASELAEHYLQVIEIDATRADVRCNDGKRYSITTAVDLFSRKSWALLSDHPKGEATAGLWRKIMLDPQGGVFEAVIQDRGKEFMNNRMEQAAAALMITLVPVKPFSPELKPHVERLIRTLGYGLFEELPGYVGHNVADRQAIRARRSFADRFGDPDEVIEVALSPEQLQETIDKWLKHVYHQRVHSALGTTPEKKAASSPRGPRKAPGERALDVLLAPAGERVVSKSGIRYRGGQYVAVELADCVGKRVEIRENAADAGIIYVFAREPFTAVGDTGELVERKAGEFHCIARDAALEGLSTGELQEAKKRQRDRLKAQAGALKALGEGVGDPITDLLEAKGKAGGKLLSMPRHERFDIPAAEQADLAAQAWEPPEAPPEMEPEEEEGPIFEWPHERHRWLRKQEEMRKLTPEEREWLEQYEMSDEYQNWLAITGQLPAEEDEEPWFDHTFERYEYLLEISKSRPLTEAERDWIEWYQGTDEYWLSYEAPYEETS